MGNAPLSFTTTESYRTSETHSISFLYLLKVDEVRKRKPLS
jgi:hypothetical protein